MDQTVKIKMQPLTPEAFEPYGKLLQSKKLIYPETEEGKVAMELLRLHIHLGLQCIQLLGMVAIEISHLCIKLLLLG